MIKMHDPRLKTAVRIILPAWLVVKIVAALITFFSLGLVDLTVFNPSIELGFQTFIFYIKSTSLGLALFIGLLALTLFSTALGFFVARNDRVWNIIGSVAYAVMLLTDIVSAVILGCFDSVFFLLLIFDLPIALCLVLYVKLCLTPKKADDDAYARQPEKN